MADSKFVNKITCEILCYIYRQKNIQRLHVKFQGMKEDRR